MTGPAALSCELVQDLVPELAMGVAPGEQRAEALAHVATCADCRTVLELTTDLVDELMLLTPRLDPPAGFEGRVLAAIAGVTRPHRRRVMWLAAAAAVIAVAAAGATRWVDSDERRLAAEYRDTLRVADGNHLRAADITARNGSSVGNVFAYSGSPSWVFMTVEGAPSGTYSVTLVMSDGTRRDIGECWVRDGWGSWGTTVDAPLGALDRILMRSADGSTYTAVLRS